ncbi:DUF1289 domain-containing protein [Roseateles sp.]|uniref:DUF1289 domain-containing protein n=1 Tax=Roseateles sp. TaxID=1971397 RepID=UPI003948DFCA
MSSPVLLSPCTRVCRMDERLGWCRGCARSLEEIARWRDADDADKQHILKGLPPRRAQLQREGRWLEPDAGAAEPLC